MFLFVVIIILSFLRLACDVGYRIKGNKGILKKISKIKIIVVVGLDSKYQ